MYTFSCRTPAVSIVTRVPRSGAISETVHENTDTEVATHVKDSFNVF